MKSIKIILSLGIILVCAAAVGAWFAKSSIESSADKNVAGFIEKAEAYKAPEAFMMNATLYVFEQLQQIPNSTSSNPWAAFKPYVTCSMLPSFLRTSEAAFDSAHPQADEKSAVGMLSYILEKRGIASIPWRILAPKGIKTAVAASLGDGTYRYLDPVAGVVAMFENKVLIGPYAAREIMMNGTHHQKVFVKLTEEADPSFYEDFAHTMMAPPGYRLDVNVAAPVYEEPIVFGAVDGNSDDVAEAAAKLDLTPFFDYIGQKYEAGIQRKVHFTDPARVTLVLADAYDAGMMTANIEPKVEGNKLIFEVPEDQPLIFNDAKVVTSWLSKKNHTPIDQLIIEKL